MKQWLFTGVTNRSYAGGLMLRARLTQKQPHHQSPSHHGRCSQRVAWQSENLFSLKLGFPVSKPSSCLLLILLMRPSEILQFSVLPDICLLTRFPDPSWTECFNWRKLPSKSRQWTCAYIKACPPPQNALTMPHPRKWILSFATAQKKYVWRDNSQACPGPILYLLTHCRNLSQSDSREQSWTTNLKGIENGEIVKWVELFFLLFLMCFSLIFFFRDRISRN